MNITSRGLPAMDWIRMREENRKMADKARSEKNGVIQR